jgi:hypothetical protein
VPKPFPNTDITAAGGADGPKRRENKPVGGWGKQKGNRWENKTNRMGNKKATGWS